MTVLDYDTEEIWMVIRKYLKFKFTCSNYYEAGYIAVTPFQIVFLVKICELKWLNLGGKFQFLSLDRIW